MRVLILDDDLSIAEFIKSLLLKFFPQIQDIVLATDAKQTGLFLQESNFHLLILDVELGSNETSLDYLDTFNIGEAKIIFITGHPDYAISAIKKKASDYILKPIDLSEFKQAIKKVFEEIERIDKPIDFDINELQRRQHKSISVNELEQIRLEKLSDIEFIEAQGAYSIIHLVSKESFMTSKHLKYYEEITIDCGFYRVHNSFLVNTLNIKQINKKDGFSVWMKSEKEVMVSVRKKEEFLEYIRKYLTI